MTQEICAQPAISTQPESQQRHAKIRVEIAARTILDQFLPTAFQVAPAFRRNLVVRAATGARLTLEGKAHFKESRQCWDGRPGRQPGSRFQFIRGRNTACNQCKHEQVKVSPAALVTACRHVNKYTNLLRSQKESRAPQIAAPGFDCIVAGFIAGASSDALVGAQFGSFPAGDTG